MFKSSLLLTIPLLAGMALHADAVWQVEFKEADKSTMSAHRLKLAQAQSRPCGIFTGREFAQWNQKIPANATVFTIEFAMYPENIKSGTIISCYNETGNQRAFNLGFSKGKLCFSVNVNGHAEGSKTLQLPAEIKKWQTVKATFAPNHSELIIDGQKVSMEGWKKFHHSNAPITIGMYATGKVKIRPYIGKLAQLKISFPTPQSEKISSRPDNLLNTPSAFKSVAGAWKIHNGIAQAQAVPESGFARLLWDSPLPAAGYLVDFEVSLDERRPAFAPEAYIGVRCDDHGKSGLGFGLNRTTGLQIAGKLFPDNQNICRSEVNTGKKWGKEWQRFALVVYGNCFEIHYPHLVLRNFFTDYAQQNRLMLCTNDVKARFRNLKVVPLAQAQIRPQLQFVSPSRNNTSLATSRPELKWEPLALNTKDDFIYDVTIKSSNRIIEKTTVNNPVYQVQRALKPGQYQIEVTARTYQGPIWGGRISRSFKVAKRHAKVPAGVVLTSKLVPAHFQNARPQFTLHWQKHPDINRVIIRHGDQRLLDRTNIKKQTTLKFTPQFDLNKGLNTFTVKFYAGKKLASSFQLYAVRTQVPVKHTIAPDGTLLRDGKIFAPVATYRDPSDDRLQTAGLTEAQFNVTHSYYFEGSHYYDEKPEERPYLSSRDSLEDAIKDAREYLRNCDRHGIKVALSIKRAWVYHQNLELIREFVAALMDEPGLLTWYLYDEPDYVGVPLPRCREAYMAIKEIDPYHPVSIIFANHGWIPRYARCADILWSQSYGKTPREVIKHGQKMLEMRKISVGFGGNTTQINPQACWIILSAFDLKFSRKTPQIHSPTPAQIQTNMFAALTVPQRGIVYYWLPKVRYSLQKDAPYIWQAVVKAGAIAQKVLPELLKPGQELNVPSDLNGIVARVRQLQSGEKIVVLVNTTEHPLTWELPGAIPQQRQKLAGRGEMTTAQGKLKITLPGLTGGAWKLQ